VREIQNGEREMRGGEEGRGLGGSIAVY
jgi:hypothetical protein